MCRVFVFSSSRLSNSSFAQYATMSAQGSTVESKQVCVLSGLVFSCLLLLLLVSSCLVFVIVVLCFAVAIIFALFFVFGHGCGLCVYVCLVFLSSQFSICLHGCLLKGPFRLAFRSTTFWIVCLVLSSLGVV